MCDHCLQFLLCMRFVLEGTQKQKCSPHSAVEHTRDCQNAMCGEWIRGVWNENSEGMKCVEHWLFSSLSPQTLPWIQCNHLKSSSKMKFSLRNDKEKYLPRVFFLGIYVLLIWDKSEVFVFLKKSNNIHLKTLADSMQFAHKHCRSVLSSVQFLFSMYMYILSFNSISPTHTV